MGFISFNESIEAGNLSKFKKIYNREPFVMLVHANWCGHCTTLKSTDGGDWDTVRDAYKAHMHVVEIEHAVLKHIYSDHSHSPQIKEIVDALQYWQPQSYPAIIEFDAKVASPKVFEQERSKENIKTLFKKAKAKKTPGATFKSPIEKAYEKRYKSTK